MVEGLLEAFHDRFIPGFRTTDRQGSYEPLLLFESQRRLLAPSRDYPRPLRRRKDSGRKAAEWPSLDIGIAVGHARRLFFFPGVAKGLAQRKGKKKTWEGRAGWSSGRAAGLVWVGGPTYSHCPSPRTQTARCMNEDAKKEKKKCRSRSSASLTDDGHNGGKKKRKKRRIRTVGRADMVRPRPASPLWAGEATTAATDALSSAGALEGWTIAGVSFMLWRRPPLSRFCSLGHIDLRRRRPRSFVLSGPCPCLSRSACFESLLFWRIDLVDSYTLYIHRQDTYACVCLTRSSWTRPTPSLPT
jgi:hypothetical protein